MDRQEKVIAVAQTVTPIRRLRGQARRLLRQLLSPLERAKTDEWSQWYQGVYRRLGERGLQCNKPGECMPELILHDVEGNEQRLGRCWEGKPALLVTMSLSCGRTRRYARELERLARRFKDAVNIAIIYVIEAHPVDVPSPYTEEIWLTPLNDIAGIRCQQPQTLEERIALARQLSRRFHLTTPMLIDALDNRAWRAFGSAPNVAILVQPDGRVFAKQGWFDPEEMEGKIKLLIADVERPMKLH